MHFRERNRTVQIIRTTYDPTTKKGRQEIVGHLRKAKPEIGEDVRANCSDSELGEIQAWITRRSAGAAVKLEHAARSLPSQIDDAVRWLQQQEMTRENEALANELMAGVSRLRLALRKKGFGKSANRRSGRGPGAERVDESSKRAI